MPDTPEKPTSYPGRAELDSANARFRRAVVRLQKEAVRHDQKLMPQLSAIVSEAAEHLDRLAGDAEAAEGSSARNRREMAASIDKQRRALLTSARRGNPRAAGLLARLEQQHGRHGDDAA